MNKNCECELAGFCARHQITKSEGQFALCRGVAPKKDCGYAFWYAWETGRLGATAPAEPLLDKWDCNGEAAKERADRISKSSKKKSKSGKSMKLGDRTERLLASIGVTKDRYAEVKRKFGLSPTCGCASRQAWLNKVGEYLGIG